MLAIVAADRRPREISYRFRFLSRWFLALGDRERAGNPDSKLVGIVITDAATTRAMPEPRGLDPWRECM